MSLHIVFFTIRCQLRKRKLEKISDSCTSKLMFVIVQDTRNDSTFVP